MLEIQNFSIWTNFILGIAGSLFLVPLIILFSKKTKVLSKLYFSKFSERPVPLLGGLSLFFAAAMASVLTKSPDLKFLLLCSIPIVFFGVLDDLIALTAKPKFIFQILASAIWVWSRPEGGLILEQVGAERFLASAASVFWMVGLINAFNLIDGMDGLAAGVIMFGALGYLVLGVPPDQAVLLAMIAGSAFGFLFFNFPPAKIYLGDVGGTFAGFIFSALGVVFKAQPSMSWSFLVPLLLFCLPEVDAILAMVRRRKYKKPLFSGDLDHLHHKLSNLGLSKIKVIAVFYSVMILATGGSYVVYNTQGLVSVAILTLSVMLLSSILFVVYTLDRLRIKKLGQKEVLHERIYAKTGTDD